VKERTIYVYLSICLSGNRWDGFLSEQRIGSGVLTPRDGVLRGKEYYFRLPGDEVGQSSTQQQLYSTQLTQTQSDSKVPPCPYFRTLALSARQAAARLVALQSTEHAGRPCVASPGQRLQRQSDVQLLHQAVVARSQLGVTDGRCVVEVESRLYLARRRDRRVSSLRTSYRASKATGWIKGVRDD
jgi:hypothetical protein